MLDYMNLAIKESQKAYKKQDIPVGCVIVLNNKVISKAYNNRQKKHSIIGHAEINAILKAERKIKDWRLNNCDMYVTLYPCEMCKSVIKESRINHVYYLLNKENNSNKEENYIQIKDENDIINKYKSSLKKFFEQLRK